MPFGPPELHYKQCAVAPKRTRRPTIFISIFKLNNIVALTNKKQTLFLSSKYTLISLTKSISIVQVSLCSIPIFATPWHYITLYPRQVACDRHPPFHPQRKKPKPEPKTNKTKTEKKKRLKNPMVPLSLFFVIIYWMQTYRAIYWLREEKIHGWLL